MGIIVETGLIVPGANSYASVADANLRLADRALDAAWQNLDDNDNKAPALIQATDFLTQRYRLMWAGTRVSGLQPLDWPRYQVPLPDAPGAYNPFSVYYPTNTVPSEVKNACIDLALKISQGVVLTPDFDPTNIIQETVGPITVKYDPNARQETLYTAVDRLLQPLLITGGGNYSIPLMRA